MFHRSESILFKRILPACVILSFFLSVITVHAQVVGEVIPPWTEGTLDIHQISTGRGNAALFIFPDGTTLLVDAGAQAGTVNARWVPARPDGSRTPGEWIVRYLRHMLPGGSLQRLDYVLLTHFHSDHMGQVSDNAKTSKSGQYKLAGITEVGDQIPIGKIMDRGWPDYQYPAPLVDNNVQNYRAFVKWQSEHNGMSIERFQPGRNDQIVLLRTPSRYPGFEVRNLMANGEVWTGVGTNVRQQFPALRDVKIEDRPSENMCSAGFRLSYGRFDYYSGGDIPGIPFEGFPQWHDVETPVAKAVGPVEVALMNHHGYIDSQNAFFVGTLRPRVWILNVWESAHPTARVYSRLQSTRIYPGPRDIFATQMHDANRVVVVGLDKLASDHGHVVVRVAPGGESYRVIVLDDASESYRVTAVHGPYESR
jgi:hypothetical protein